MRTKMYLAEIWWGSATVEGLAAVRGDTYVDEQQGADQETGKSKAVAYDLHGRASRAEGGGSDVGSAVVVDDNTDRDVEGSHDGLADDQSAAIVGGLTHLGDDGEEGRGAGVCEDDGGEGGDGAVEARIVDNLVVGDPDTFLWCGRWAVLNANSDSHDQDCCVRLERDHRGTCRVTHWK